MQEGGSGLSNAGMVSESRCSCGTGACRSFRFDGGASGHLPTDAAARKHLPIATGVLDYFPLALAAVAAVSIAGQRQHGTTGWDRSKSGDEGDALIRHFLGRGSLDSDGLRHSAKMAWRALALLQKECEQATMSNKEDYMQIVAWRVKDFADGWILFHDEHLAREEVAATGATIEPLYRLMKKSEVDQ